MRHRYTERVLVSAVVQRSSGFCVFCLPSALQQRRITSRLPHLCCEKSPEQGPGPLPVLLLQYRPHQQFRKDSYLEQFLMLWICPLLLLCFLAYPARQPDLQG